MERIPQPNGKDNIASHPIVQQLRKDVDQIGPALTDVQQMCKYLVKQDGVHRDQARMLIAEFTALKDLVITVIDNTNRIIALLMPSQEP